MGDELRAKTTSSSVVRDNEPLRKKLKPLKSTQKPTGLRYSHLFEEREEGRKGERKEGRKEGRKKGNRLLFLLQRFKLKSSAAHKL